jgi:hypothetical protein
MTTYDFALSRHDGPGCIRPIARKQRGRTVQDAYTKLVWLLCQRGYTPDQLALVAAAEETPEGWKPLDTTRRTGDREPSPLRGARGGGPTHARRDDNE